MLTRSDRVLILGGTGWFGSTLRSLLPGDTPVLFTSSGKGDPSTVWSFRRIAHFAPTIVVNCAFLTPDKEIDLGRARFAEVNRRLIDQFLRAMSLPTVRQAITISSGATVTMRTTTYAQLKREEEEAALAQASPSLTVVVARVFSVSGALVRNKALYAFSDIVSQALGGHVFVRSTRPTFRRYSSVSDILRVSHGLASLGVSGVFESGGELIELGDLAERTVSLVNPKAMITRPPLTTEDAEVYASDGLSWASACLRLGYRPMDLDNQVLAVADAWRSLKDPLGFHQSPDKSSSGSGKSFP